MSEQDRHSYTTHRVRAGAFQQRTSYPARELYPRDLGYCYGAKRSEGPVWQEVGPMNSGGRLTSLVIDPHDRDRIFVGAAAGGVWTSDLGRQWTSIWSDQSPTLNIGALAIHNTAPNGPPPNGEPGFILYAGTGEANLSGDNYPGVGLFRNVDGGKTKLWSRVGDIQDQIAPETASAPLFVVRGLPRRIGCIAVDPFTPDHILAGGVKHNADEMAALFETRDGGNTWGLAIDDRPENAAAIALLSNAQGIAVFISRLSYFCHAVMFHPQHKDMVFAAVETRGAQSGIWISKDAARSWSHATNGLPSGDQFGRTSIAFAGDGRTVYALVGQQGTQDLVGVFRSNDLGVHWTECGKGAFLRDGQLSYTNCIAAHPEDPGTVVVGSLDLHKSTNGGRTWERISNGRLFEGRPGYVHHDHHAVVLNGDRIYSANDGGFALSENGGKTWTTRNTGLAVSMFYDLDISQRNSECLGGGTQDLGTWFRGPLLQSEPTESAAPAVIREFRDELFGDGGWTCYDPDDDCHVFACSQRMQLWRHTSREGWTQLDLGSGAPPEERNQVWMAAVAMDCSRSNGKRRKPRAIYIASHRLWRSLDDGETWKPFEEEFDRSVITAVEVASADPNVIYVGTTNGGIFCSRDGGKNWSRNLAGPMGPGRLITRIETRPDDANNVHYTIGLVAESYDTGDPNARPSPRLQRAGLPRTRNGRQEVVEFFHLYTSLDGGETWSFSEGQSLPNLPHNAVVALPENATAVAHDGGVELNLGDGFRDITGTLPNTRITDLVYHEHDGDLYVSTYGRGIWRVSREEVFRWSRGRPAARADQKPTDSGGTKSSTDRPTAVPLARK